MARCAHSKHPRHQRFPHEKPVHKLASTIMQYKWKHYMSTLESIRDVFTLILELAIIILQYEWTIHTAGLWQPHSLQLAIIITQYEYPIDIRFHFNLRILLRNQDGKHLSICDTLLILDASGKSGIMNSAYTIKAALEVHLWYSQSILKNRQSTWREYAFNYSRRIVIKQFEIPPSRVTNCYF